MDMNYALSQTIRSFIWKVYAWMAAALAITASVAYYVFSNQLLFKKLFSNNFFIILLLIVQLIFVFMLTFFMFRISYMTAVIVYLLYAISVGITFSAIFYQFSISSIVVTFAVCSSMFAAMALYGYFTKKDLTALGSYALMALIGLIVALLLNMLFKSPQFDFVISLFGVALFSFLTAYDMQRIIKIGLALSGQGALQDKFALFGALALYLDFINLFLMLLRFTGRQRE